MNSKRIAAIALSFCIAAAAPAEVFAEAYPAEAAELQQSYDQAFLTESDQAQENDQEQTSPDEMSVKREGMATDTAWDQADSIFPQDAVEVPAENAENADTAGDHGQKTEDKSAGEAADVPEKTDFATKTQDGEQQGADQSAEDEGSSGLPSGGENEKSSVDKANLNATIADAKTRSIKNYTAQSAALFQAAIAAAAEVSEDADATAEQVKQAEQMLVKTFTALMEKEPDTSAREKAKSGKYDGTYTVSGKLMHATSANQESMGNNALKKPFQVIVSKGIPTLRFEFVPLTSKFGKISFTGYLGKLNYFPGYTGTSVPAKVTPRTCTVESYYDVFDTYNDADTGSDPNMKGKKYPHFVQMPADFSENSYFVQVYVSVMEAISPGSGTQFAKLVLDWDTLAQTAGTITDQTALKSKANLLRSFLNAWKAGKAVVTYTSAKKQLLQAAAASGEAALADLNITQAEVDGTAEALEAVRAFLEIKEAADKIKLQKAIKKADTYLGKTAVYTSGSLKKLKTAREKGNQLYENYLATQKQVDDQTAAINDAIKGLKKITPAKVTSAKVSKKKLKAALKKAGRLLKKTRKYTKKSLQKLKKVRKTAYQVYKKKKATQTQVDRQTKKLNAAIKKLKKKKTSSAGNKSAGNSSTGSAETDSTVQQEKADFSNLKDGVYTISGSMVKIDKSTASMSNDAIDHTLKLTVKGGTYYITMRFKGLKINNMLGYLGKLRYFQTGYTLDGNGNPQGSLADAQVESYQTDSSGSRVKDDLGTDYPKEVTFPLISEARQDGFVPLQVFVPVMESISSGTGTQPVFLKLDQNSVYTGYSASSDSGAAGQSSLPGSPAGSGGSGSGTKTAGAASLGGSTLGGSTLGGTSSLGSGSSTSGGEDAAEAASEKDAAESEMKLGGIGSLGGNDTFAGDTSVTEADADAGLVQAEDSEEEGDAFEDAYEETDEEAEQEPPLRKIVKPMGIGTPLLALMLTVIYLKRRKGNTH